MLFVSEGGLFEGEGGEGAVGVEVEDVGFSCDVGAVVEGMGGVFLVARIICYGFTEPRI